MKDYHLVMQEQTDNGILVNITEKQSGNIIHYIFHEKIGKKHEESIMMR